MNVKNPNESENRMEKDHLIQFNLNITTTEN